MDTKRQTISYKVHIDDFDMFYEKYKNIHSKNDLKRMKEKYYIRKLKTLLFQYNAFGYFSWGYCISGNKIKHNNICHHCSNLKCKVKDFKYELRIEKLKTII